MARRHNEISAVERGGAYADQHLVGLGHGLFHVANFNPRVAQYGGFHRHFSKRDAAERQERCAESTWAETRSPARHPTRLGGPNRIGRAAISAARPIG